MVGSKQWVSQYRWRTTEHKNVVGMSPKCDHTPLMLYSQLFEHALRDEIPEHSYLVKLLFSAPFPLLKIKTKFY